MSVNDIPNNAVLAVNKSEPAVGHLIKSDGPREQYINKGYDDSEDKDERNGDSKAAKVEDEAESEIPPIGFFSLFRYSSACDKMLLIFATIIATVSGASMPAIMIIFGKIIDKLIDFDASNRNYTNVTMTKEEFLHETAVLCYWNAGFGFAFLVCNYIMVSFFSIAAANQAYKIRCMFMASVLKQEIGWFDTNQTGDFASRISGDLTKIQDGMGEKVGICIGFLSSTFLCVGCGIYYGWKLALVILCVTPILTIAMAIMSKIQATVSREELQAYGTAGAVAEEVLSAIRTVVAFGGERKEIQRYEKCLAPARQKGIKRGLMTSIGASLTWFCIFAGYALAFWYGVKLIMEGMGKPNPEYTGGTLIIVFFNVMSASMFIGQTAPYFEAFAVARGAAAKVFNIIDREPLIDSSSEDGLKPQSVSGNIKLKEVHFNYPARSSVQVLKGLSLDVAPGETVALVGPSGCGKSTVIQLVLRFYDTHTGSVELDGCNVKDLNVGWLRDHIGLVGQEPVLFSTTIAENIRYGNFDATDEEIIQAAKIANAHNFIEALPLKYNTLVGERGTQLSGGQKQRIAIARALIKNPKILLLDEATSALDTESESVVQAALDEARLGRTTIIVAHRLSTIRTADKIVVIAEGVVKELGTHDELMMMKGIYYELVQTQTNEAEEEEDEEIDEIEDLPELERRISVLSGGSNASDEALPAYERQVSRQSSRLDRQTSATSGYDRQISAGSGSDRRKFSVEVKKDIALLGEDEENEKASPSQMRLLKVSAPEWPYAVVGGISAILMGLHFPLFGVIFGNILGVLALPIDEIPEQRDFFCLLFLLMAITSGVFSFLQIFMFSIAGEKLTCRLRQMVFANIITQDIAFFDHPKNSVGSLCVRLTSDASSVQGATGSRISTLLQAISTLIVAITLGMWYNYKIGLVVLSFIPFVLLATYFESRIVSGHMASEKTGFEDASKVAIEALESIRTVASLHQEKRFYAKFRDALLAPHKKSKLKSHIRGITYGFAQAIQSFAYAAAMYYGSILVANNELSYGNLLKVVEGILVGIMVVGQTIAFAPDFQKAKIAAVRIFKLLDIKPQIDAFSEEGKKLANVNGDIRFSRVRFNYPSRPDVKILRGLSLEIEPGKTVALVGSSGCGKSTCVQLIERFYDAQQGKVLLDEENVRDMNVANLRTHIGLVSQEPILFSYSIAENIAYGDNTQEIDMNKVIAAARQANIHQFITTLPQGYDTPVGDKGTQLSGGQKQRVAIARALLRNPKILLLDEATSALDAESEKVVQEALDKARSGRTCLIIAHRLTTIQNADTIMVIHKGRIVEKGTHQELLNKRGHYYNLHNTSNGS
ncbi:ATP-dependent translocase ABCB1-like isoform X1 [Stegodyphus dumicola]|uniref:ATP-dependent translocase ABCB1-like isoform X1 n=1 Tax=Stegodyphus dumicola TaxID=202533 RepID=UPI0015AFE95C|nr:ATP-dependent translocase ABCB1-like isoform X1 [Stegodyphus dumicola]